MAAPSHLHLPGCPQTLALPLPWPRGFSAPPGLLSRSRRLRPVAALGPADAGDLLGRVEALLYTVADAAVSAEPVAAAGTKEAAAGDWLSSITNSMETVLKVLKDGLLSLHVPYSYGFAIILLTVLVKAATFPLTKKQVESALAMRSLQPQVKTIQERYAGDQERIQLETARLYKLSGVDPLAVSSVPFQMTNSTETLSPSSDDGQFDEGNDSDPADSQQRRLPPQPPRESVHLRIGAQFVSGRSRALCSVEEAERMGLGASSGLNAQHSMRPLEDCPTWGDEMGMQLVCGASGPSRQICGALGPSRRICGQPSIDACVAQLNNAQLDARAGSFISVERSQESPSPSWKQCRQLANEARDLGVRAASFNDEERTKVPLAVGSLNQLRSASPQYHLAAGPLEGDRTDSPQATGPLGFTGEARQDDLVAEPVDWATTDLTHQMCISETERTTLTLGDHVAADSGRKSSTGNLLHQSIHCTTGIEQPGMLHIRGLQSSKKLMVYSRKRFNSRDKSGNMNEEGSGPIASVLRIDTDENTVSTVREVSLAVTTDGSQSTSQETQTGSTQLKNKQFLSKLSKKISGLLATPEDPPFMTSKNAQVAEIIPRRSRRIAGVGVEFDNMDLSSRTTKKVMQALKVIGDPGAVTQQAKEDYLKVFSTELPISHIEALASFFGWVGLLTEGFFWIPSLAGPTTIAAQQNGQGISWLFPFTDGHPPLGWSDTLAYLVLPVLLVISQYISSQVMQPPQSNDPSQQGAQAVTKFLPLLIGYFALSVPSGLESRYCPSAAAFLNGLGALSQLLCSIDTVPPNNQNIYQYCL
ncbi:ALBINO3-like protein 1 chloroplastic [Zea mays]|uniref:ALBINO3-like protein 1 chloroplastic n=1 Tax=Zea mays TaxID=4577 RepID=A0A1D6LBP8_MAIZE|nr:ALBINO3-like protein 1 chloroplastic [Zea mays]ONM11524.1 ALBINO3-like protein 1 chloroplastic [Zea mays]